MQRSEPRLQEMHDRAVLSLLVACNLRWRFRAGMGWRRSFHSFREFQQQLPHGCFAAINLNDAGASSWRSIAALPRADLTAASAERITSATSLQLAQRIVEDHQASG